MPIPSDYDQKRWAARAGTSSRDTALKALRAIRSAGGAQRLGDKLPADKRPSLVITIGGGGENEPYDDVDEEDMADGDADD